MTTTRALVHLGPIKTGTTALSRYFTLTNRAGITPRSIVFPTGDLWFGEDGDIVRQRYQLEALMNRRDSPHSHPAAAEPGSELDSALARVADALRATDEKTATAVFVVETGLPRFDPARLDAVLRRHFDSVDYLFMARRQDKLVSSIVAQNMKMAERRWSTLSPRWELAKWPPLRDFAALDYVVQATRWSAVVGEEHVIVVPYDEGDQGSFATIDRIFDFARLGTAPRVDGIEGLRIHPTFSVYGMKRMAWLKGITRLAWLWPPFRPRLTAVWESWTVKYHNQAIEGRPDEDGTPFTPWSLSNSDRRWVMRRFLGVNRKLRAMHTDHAAAWDEWLARVEEASR
ncbi:MAG: hypothetical protein RLZZ319_193 [Actinomycetota bacterium]